MKTIDVFNELSDFADHLEGKKGCPYCGICQDYLLPQQYSECYKDINLCSKADMVKIRMLNAILDRLADIDKHL